MIDRGMFKAVLLLMACISQAASATNNIRTTDFALRTEAAVTRTRPQETDSLLLHHTKAHSLHSLRHLQATVAEVDDYENSANSLDAICAGLERQFFVQNSNNPISCDCVGALRSRTLSVTCEWAEPICSGSLIFGASTCARPILAWTIVNAKIFSSTTCLHDYHKLEKVTFSAQASFGVEETVTPATGPNVEVNATHIVTSYADTCISVDLCDESDALQGLCGCDAQVGTQRCQSCEVCQSGTPDAGIRLNCTHSNDPDYPVIENPPPLAMASSSAGGEDGGGVCQRIDTDLDLAGGAGQILGFLPDFEAFCQSLAVGTTFGDRVECECDNRGQGNFDIRCWTNNTTTTTSTPTSTTGSRLEDTSTTMRIEKGALVSVETCSVTTNDIIKERVTQCTTVEVDIGDSETSVAACRETINGQACQSCEACDNGQGVVSDCSNVPEFEKLQQMLYPDDDAKQTCRPASMERAFEVLPQGLTPPVQTPVIGGASSGSSDTSPILPTGFFTLSIAIFTTLFVLWK